jgi:hypothetical protein
MREEIDRADRRLTYLDAALFTCPAAGTSSTTHLDRFLVLLRGYD